ncbi:topoisomerase DNA-binding C4 zinc finger domain-containing protein [Aquimarina hainanensis]|uniref:Topoisomerase DNA-binding C4 zinc finger domain-containing protein n=1 Tax=Aquimarina hainanensis TaxID=1578017 RepID=A0ABW5NDK0_9FLAO
MNIKCNDCTGHYVLREGKYGEFGGCSNYPKRTSSLKLHDLIFRFFVEEDINLYKWSRKCYKCKKDAEVYSYYLYYQLEKLDECFNYSHGLGIGDLSWIDN